jgi:hypothetical protein
MPRKRKALMPDAALAPVPSEILDQLVRQGPLSPGSSTPRCVGSRKPSSNARSAAS